MRTITAIAEWDEESKLYVGIVPEMPGAFTQAATLEELDENLKEVIELWMEECGDKTDVPKFVGLRQIEIAA